MVAIIFMAGTKYACNFDNKGDYICYGLYISIYKHIQGNKHISNAVKKRTFGVSSDALIENSNSHQIHFYLRHLILFHLQINDSENLPEIDHGLEYLDLCFRWADFICIFKILGLVFWNFGPMNFIKYSPVIIW